MLNQLIEELKEKNITISFSKGKMQYSGPEENIDNELLAKLKEYKPKLLKHFWPKECPNMMPINTEGDLTPIALLHGGPSNYPISDYLGKNRPFYGFFYIGSEGEKIRYKTLEDFAGEYLKQLQNIVPEGPYILGGLSMGGHLAFDMALQLQRQGHKVPLLILVDSGLITYVPPVHYPQFFKRVFHKIYEALKSVFYWVYNKSRKMIYDLFSSFYDKLPAKKRKKYIMWIYGELMSRYKPTEKFNGKILLFKATDAFMNEEYLGWDNVCDDITKVYYDGDHGSMFNDKVAVDVIKTNIDEWLKKNEFKKKKQLVSA